MSPDTHVSLTTIFSLPKGKTAKDYIDKLYARAKVTKRSIYYGFATNENKLMCREGYENAEEFLLYMKEIVSCQLGDEVTILVSGPDLELDKIKPKLTASLQAEITFAKLNNDNMLLGRLPESTTDTHVTVLPEITVPQGRMTEFKSVMEKFCTAAKNGTTGCLYYGFAVSGDKVWCREGYTGAQGVLDHLTEVKHPMKRGSRFWERRGSRSTSLDPHQSWRNSDLLWLPWAPSSGNLTTGRIGNKPLCLVHVLFNINIFYDCYYSAK